MGKKKRKGTNSHLQDSASFSTLDDGDLSVGSLNSSNISLNEDFTVPEQFIIASADFSGCEAYAACLKSDLENVVFLHPFIMRAYGIQDLVLIEGEQRRTVCVAHPLKNVKKSLIVFPKDVYIFKYNELVRLKPFCDEIRNAEQIIISMHGERRNVDSSMIEFISKLLYNKYIFVGLSIKWKLFDQDYECTIKDITCSCDLANLSLNETANSCDTKFYAMSFKTVLKHESLAVQPKDKISAFTHIGGLDKQITTLNRHIQLFLCTEKYSGSVFCGTLMLHGPPGTGKSLLLNAISKHYNIFLQHICWYQLCAMSQSAVKTELRTLLQTAVNRAPSIIVIDEFNHLCPSRTLAENIQQYISKTLSLLLRNLEDAKVMIIAATNDSNYEASVLLTPRRLTEVIKFQIPSLCDREDILKKLLQSRKHELTYEQIQECAGLAHGFTGRDLLDSIEDAQIFYHKRKFSNSLYDDDVLNSLSKKNFEIGPILYSDLKLTIKLKKPTIVAASNLQVKKVQWTDIGGMSDVKEKLKQLVEWPLKYPEAFKHFNITPSRGVLMYGPPGCSKTMIAKALATECELNFISKNASDLFDKYVGESEKAVRDLFALAKAKAPCIIFLDEIDALVAERGSSSGASGVGDRIVTTLLTEMDGIEELQGVIIIAATNRPDMLDDALVRNGRINHFIYVPLPDAPTREEILRISMKNRLVSKDFDFKFMAENTEGYSGAEIVNICNEAALQVLAEDPKAESPVFTIYHFKEVFCQVLPRTSKEMIKFYEGFNEKHCTKLS